MRVRQSLYACVLAAVSVLPGISATLGVQASVTPDGGLFDYSYQFYVSGVGAQVDNIFLGSDDLSPLNVSFLVDGGPTIGWSWLANDVPQSFLQFFDTNGALGNGDVLSVNFSSQLAPSASFAVAFESLTSTATNQVSDVPAPGLTPTPEPASFLLFAAGILCFYSARRRRPAL